MFAAKTMWYLFRVPQIVCLNRCSFPPVWFHTRAVHCEHNWSKVSSAGAGVHNALLSMSHRLQQPFPSTFGALVQSLELDFMLTYHLKYVVRSGSSDQVETYLVGDLRLDVANCRSWSTASQSRPLGPVGIHTSRGLNPHQRYSQLQKEKSKVLQEETQNKVWNLLL